MVPGSTFRYGSSLRNRTENPRACNSAPRAADAKPLPSEETTPPVMNMNRAMGLNFYSEATDSTRGKSRRPQLFLKSNRSYFMLVRQRVRQPSSDPAFPFPPGSAGIPPALSLPKKRARRPRSQEGREGAPRHRQPPKTEGPEIRPSG